MTAEEREAEIKRRGEWLAYHTGQVTHHKKLALDHLTAIRSLIAQRTPAEVEQMERERGLR